MLAISVYFAIFSLLLTGDVVVNAKPHHSPLERRINKHRRRNGNDNTSPSAPPLPLVARDDSEPSVYWVDVTSTTTITASASSSAAQQSSNPQNSNNDPPPVVGAILTGQDGGSNADDQGKTVIVDVTSTVYATAHEGGENVQPAQYQPTQAPPQQQGQGQKQPAATTITATKTNGIPKVAAIAISTGKGITTTIQETYTAPAVTMTTATAEPTNQRGPEAQALWLAAHNTRRVQYGNVGNLTWSDELTVLAQNKASLCNKEHTKAAENLQWGSGMGTPEGAVKAWVDDELAFYDFSNPHYSDEAGHLSQVVWKNTTTVGCWIFSCDRGKVVDYKYEQSFQTACEYDPPGNVIGFDEYGQNNFQVNVKPPW